MANFHFGPWQIADVDASKWGPRRAGDLCAAIDTVKLYVSTDGSTWTEKSAQGASGSQGAKGDNGDTGNTGSAGADGAQGSQGIQGIQGIQGVQGPAGPSVGTAAFGYATGAGGTVSQSTSKSTGVTLNKLCGQITMNAAALAAAAEVAFTLTNNQIAATDVVVVCIQSVGTAGSYFVTVGAVAAGSCSITLGNTSAGSLSQAVVLNFVVIKGVAA